MSDQENKKNENQEEIKNGEKESLGLTDDQLEDVTGGQGPNHPPTPQWNPVV